MNRRLTEDRQSAYGEMLEQAALAKHPHLLVVIDRRDTTVYRTGLHANVPPVRISSADPFGENRQLAIVQDETRGLTAERPSYYKAVAETLHAANPEAILLFGHGRGNSSAMHQLLAELKHRHPQLARRVIGTVVVDEPHMTEEQLLAKAREHFAHIKL